MGMMSETISNRARPLWEAQQEPDPEKFVPVFSWDSKHVWVWVKKPGGKVVGPVEVPHDQVHKYKGKLGWLAKKTEYTALLDPGWYAGVEDLYPATWKPGDSLAIGQLPSEKITAAFKPFTVTPEKAAKKPKTIPPEFTLTGKKDPHGYQTVEDEATGEEYSLLPDDKIGQWTPEEGVYYIAKKLPGEDWAVHLDSPVYKPHELEPKTSLPPMDPPKDFELPPNYTIKKVAPSYVLATTPDGTDVKWIKATDHWVHADDPTKEHEPLQAAVPKVKKYPKVPKKKAAPKAPPAGKPSTPKPEEKKVVSKTAEPAPHMTKYLGQVDDNGLPLVDEVPEGDYEEEEVAKGLTLLPDDRVARWRPTEGVYLIYDYDPYFGFMFSKSGETVTPDEAKQLMAALHLTVHAGRYHKYDVAGAEAPQPTTYSAPLPDHCKSISGTDVNGLPMVLTVPEDPYDEAHKLTVFPNARVGRWDSLSKKYLYWEWREILGDYNYYPTHPAEYVSLKEIQKMQAQAGGGPVPAPAPAVITGLIWPTKQKPKPKVSKPNAPPPSPSTTAAKPPPVPAKPPVLAGALKPTGKDDPLGYHIGSYKGSTYSMLPDKKVGVWSAVSGAYILYDYDPLGDAFFNTGYTWTPPGKHKALAYVSLVGLDHAQLEDSTGKSVVVLANGKFARHEKGAWFAYKVDPAQGKKFVPTGEEISSETMAAIAKTPSYKTMKPTGEVDENGLPTYKIVKGPTKGKVFTMLPTGSLAHYNPKSKSYRLMSFDPDIEGWELSWPKETFTLNDINAMYLKVGSEPMEPKETAPTEKPAPKVPTEPQTPVFVTPQGKLPDPKTLKDLGGVGLLGAGPDKTVLQDPKTGQRYLFKPALPKGGAKVVQPYKAKSQEGFAAVAALVRPDAHVPVETVTHNGKLGTIQPMLDLDPNQPDLNGVNPADLTDQQKLDVADEHLLDWLMSQHDSFASNFVITKEGRVVGIDKEQGWRYVNDPKYPDRLATDYKPNSEIYGEQEPYYNKFWKAFAAGKMDFDPTQMAPALSRVEAMDPLVLEKALSEYADTVKRMQGPAKAYDRYAFMKQMLSRKNTLRYDFEKFITEQYEKRTGKKGVFTFKAGWKPEGVEEGPKYETISQSARDWALKEFGPKALKPHKDFPELILVRVQNDEPITKVQEFLSKMGVEPATTDPDGNPLPMNPILGSNYNSVIVKVSDLEKVVKRKVEIKKDPGQKYADHTGVPTYQAQVLAPPDAPGNVDGLATAHKEHLGPLGKDFTLDSDAVEQQTASVQRVIGQDGETYYRAHFKLRRPYWEPLVHTGKSGTFTWPLGAYEPDKDALVISSYQSGAHSEPARVFKSGKDELYLITGETNWAFMGSVYVLIRSGEGKVKAALTKLLKELGLDKKVLTDPTSEDIRLYNLTQALWYLSPKAHKELADSGDLTLDAVTKRLKGRLTKEEMEGIRQVTGTVGRGSAMVPGLWRKLGGGTPEKPVIRFVFWNVRTTSVPKILRSAATGVHERVRMGLPGGATGHGASEEQDMATGGADTTTMRISTAQAGNVPISVVGNIHREVRIIIAPELLDRLDISLATGDAFGCQRYSGYKSEYFRQRQGMSNAIKTFDGGGASTHKGNTEIQIRRGVPPNLIKRVCTTSEHHRKEVLANCEKVGITEHNKVPIEDFVVVEDNAGTIYNKYIKPLGY